MKGIASAGAAKQLLLASSTSLALVFAAGAAWAQETTPTPTTPAAEAEPEAAEAQEVDEVVVTARKRDESLQDVSAAVSVVSAERLQERGAVDVRDIQALVPTVTVGETVGLLKINIRGLGNSTNTRSEDPDVVLHVDGAVISRMEAQTAAFFDLERIEVLRGPQGTLYGRNSTGGTINLITRKPTRTFEGLIDVSVGNYDLFRIDAAAGGPVTDQISVRGAVQIINRSGFGENIGTGNDVDDQKRSAARLHVLYEPNDQVDLLFTAEYAVQDDASGFFSFLAPQFAGVVPRGAGGFSDPNSRDAASSIDPQLEKVTWSLTNTLDWDVSENWTIRNLINYRRLDFFLAQDLDTSTVAGATVVAIPLKDDQFSEELQAVYSSARLDLILGAFYFKETFSGTQNIGTGPFQGVFFRQTGRSETEALAAFFNAAYNLNDQFTARVGGRYTSEDRSIVNDAVVNGVRTTTDDDVSDDERSISKYTGEYGIDYNFNGGDSLLYATYSQGFRSGAALIFQNNSGIIDPTEVDNFEVGYKFELDSLDFNGNLAAFNSTAKNLQATQASLSPTGGLVTRVNNVNELKTHGVEFDFAWRPIDRLRLSGAAAYLRAEFQDFVSDDPIRLGNNPIQVAGNTPRLAPEFKGNLRVEYDFILPRDAILTASADVAYVGDQFFDEFNRAPFSEDAYTLADASLTYRPGSRDWRLALWGRNLFDETRFADVSFSAFGGVLSKTFIQPRTFGVSASYEF